jgi:hypothetical protein
MSVPAVLLLLGVLTAAIVIHMLPSTQHIFGARARANAACT